MGTSAAKPSPPTYSEAERALIDTEIQICRFPSFNGSDGTFPKIEELTVDVPRSNFGDPARTGMN